MANSIGHGALPYAVKGARFTVLVPFLDADGDPLNPTTPDTEVSKDGGDFADAAEEVTTIVGSNGMGYITLTGAETDASLVGLAAKVASGPKNTLLTLSPRLLPILESGTAQAGAAGSITLAAGAAAYDLTGCIVKTTGGTGGGGAGGANNQARRITAYNTGTKAATIVPDWEVNPDATTTYDVLISELSPNAVLGRFLRPTTDGRTLDVSAGGEAGIDWANVGSPATVQALSGTTVKTATDVEVDTVDIQARLPASLVGSRMAANAEVVGDKTGYSLSAAGVQAIWDALTSALTAVGSIGKKLADWVLGTDNRVLSSSDAHTSGVTVAAVTGAVGSVTGAVGSVTGAVGSVTGAVGSVTGAVGSVTGAVGSVTGAVGSVTGNVGGNVTGSVGSLAAQAKLDVNAEVDSALDTAIPAVPTANSVNERIQTLDDNFTATVAGRIDAAVSSRASQTTLDAVDDYVDTEVAAIKAKTDLISAAPAAVGDIPTVAQIVAGLKAEPFDGVALQDLLAEIHGFAAGNATEEETGKRVRFYRAGGGSFVLSIVGNKRTKS